MWLEGFSREAAFTFRWAHCKDDRDFYHIWWESGKKNLSVGVCISLVGKARKYSFWRRWGWGSLWTLNFGRRGWGSSLEQGNVWHLPDPFAPIPATCLTLSFHSLSLRILWVEVLQLDTLKMRPLSLWDQFSAELILGRAALKGKLVQTRHCPLLLPGSWLRAEPACTQPCTLSSGDPALWPCESWSSVLILLGKAVG